MNTARYRPSAAAAHAAHATPDAASAPSRGTPAAATTQHAAIPTAPTTMPMVPARAVDALSDIKVIRRLATATDGAEENRPENALGDVTSPTRAKATTSAPPASPRRAITPTSPIAAGPFGHHHVVIPRPDAAEATG